jgi:hypothetical protein
MNFAIRPLLWLPLLWGCSAPPHNPLSRHILPVGVDGQLVPLARVETGQPQSELDALTESQYLDRLLAAAEAAAEHRAERRRSAQRGRETEPHESAIHVPLLVHVHGGLVGRGAAAEQADRLISAIEAEDTEWFYPLFVHWNSGGLHTTWTRHRNLRQGRRWTGLLAPLSMPVLVATDLLRGVARAPMSITYQYLRDGGVALRVLTGFEPLRSTRDAEAVAIAMADAPALPGDDLTYDVRPASYRRTVLEHGLRLLAYFPTQVVLKLPTQVLILEGLGHSGWTEMRRRAGQLSWRPETYETELDGRGSSELRRVVQSPTRTASDHGAPPPEIEPHGPNGLLAELFRAIAARALDDSYRYSVTIVAHSMGAIAVNDALEAFGNPRQEPTWDPWSLVDRIVYMAPACTVGEAADSLVPFLQRWPKAQFHYLALHPIAEADEFNYLDTLPRGSLLEWIDVYYSEHATHDERVFGKWTNAMLGLRRFSAVRERVHFKCFDVEPGHIPQRHGDFNHLPFWRAVCYGTGARPSGPPPTPRSDPPPEPPAAGPEPGGSFPADWLEQWLGEP